MKINVCLCCRHRLWPALKGGHGEQRHHAVQDVVKVKLAVLPFSLGPFRFPYISILIHDVGAPADTQTQIFHLFHPGLLM